PCQHPIVFLKDVTFANLESILDFMYHGEVNVLQTELETFIKIAEALEVKGITQVEKENETESYIEACSPISTGDPSDPRLAPFREEVINTPDTQSTECPPPKRLRGQLREPTHSTEKSNEIVQGENRQCSVKVESLDLTDENAVLLMRSDAKNTRKEADDNIE
ncbi:unnamed protein product, partial [Meganyctiphanes norvegica]